MFLTRLVVWLSQNLGKCYTDYILVNNLCDSHSGARGIHLSLYEKVII